MNELKNIMEIIDRHSNVIPEGDYLKICNNMREVYRVKEGRSTFFDYNDTILSDSSGVYFEMEFMERARELDYDYLEHQLEYLISEKERSLPFQRISKTIKTLVVKHYCEYCEIELDHYSPEKLKEFLGKNNIISEEKFDNFFKGKCRSYLHMENQFRNKYIVALNRRIEYIRECSLFI